MLIYSGIGKNSISMVSDFDHKKHVPEFYKEPKNIEVDSKE